MMQQNVPAVAQLARHGKANRGQWHAVCRNTLVVAVSVAWLVGCSRAPTPAERLAEATQQVAHGQTAAAIATLQQLRREFPTDGQVLENLALAYSQAAQHRQAAETFGELGRLGGNWHDFYLFAASEANLANDGRMALQWYSLYLQGRPRDTNVHRQYGDLLLVDGQTEAAYAAYQQADAIAPRGELALRLGHCQRAVGNPGAAVAHYREAIRRGDGAEADALLAMIETLVETNQWGEAEAALAELDRRNPRRLEAVGASRLRDVITQARQAEQVAATERAAAEAAAALAARQTDAEAYARETERLAAELEARRRPLVEPIDQLARPVSEETAASPPTAAPAGPGATASPPVGAASPLPETPATLPSWPTVAPVVARDPVAEVRRLLDAGRLPEAAALANQRLGTDGGNAALWAILSEVHLRQGQPREAEMTALVAVEREPTNEQYALVYLRAARARLTPARFLEEVQRVRERFPGQPEINLNLARAWQAIESYPRNAVIFYREFLRLAPANHPERAAVERELSVLLPRLAEP